MTGQQFKQSTSKRTGRDSCLQGDSRKPGASRNAKLPCRSLFCFKYRISIGGWGNVSGVVVSLPQPRPGPWRGRLAIGDS
jgi:hypothetical protein